MSRALSKAGKLREAFESNGVIRIVGAHDGLGAKLVELSGFDGVWASGLEISASHALPDANILTMTQYLEAASIMNDAVTLPVIADCDTGYGNSNNVMHMVRKYEAAGIAAVAIEDKKFPKVNSYVPGRQELASIAEFVGKIMAAKNTQQTKDFMIIARVEALIAGWGQEEALRRAHAYADAGADAIIIHSKASVPDEITAFVHAWDSSTPLVIIPTTYPMLTVDEIERLGVKMVIYANHGMRAAIKAVSEVLSEIREEGRLDVVEPKIVPMSTVFELQGMTQMKESEKHFLKSDDGSINVIIPAAGAPRNQESLDLLLEGIPPAMLDINGKTLLQRNVETLNRSGLREITVVTGYQKDSFDVEEVNYIHNDRYDSEHIMTSLMCAEAKFDGRTLIAYSDILFERSLVERLKLVEADFVIVADASMMDSLSRSKKLDLVATHESLPKGKRNLSYDRLYTVDRIGAAFPDEVRAAEFTGLLMLSAKGAEIFREEFHKALEEYRDRTFFAAKNIRQAGLVDFLNHLISLGYEVNALQVNSGWMEIHTFDNYKHACSITAGL